MGCDFDIDPGEVWPASIQLCVQHAGDTLYFGTGVEHSTCTLSNFSLAVGSQGHTETWPELIRAANRGDVRRVEKLLQGAGSKRELEEMLSATAGSYGHAALHRAALHGFGQVAEALLERGANSQQRDGEGLTPSFLAAFSGHGELLQTLARHGVKLADEIDGKGATPMQWAATQGHHSVVELLMDKHQVSHKRKDFHGGGPISSAATMGHSEVLRRLLQRRADLEESDERGMRPLHWAALHGHGAVSEHLLHVGAESNAKNSEGQRPVDLALENSRQEVLDVLKAWRKRKRKQQGSVHAASAGTEL